MARPLRARVHGGHIDEPIVYVLLASAAVTATILRVAIVAKRWAWHPEARAR